MKTFDKLTNNDILYIYFTDNTISTYFISKIYKENTGVYITVTPYTDTDKQYNSLLILPCNFSFNMVNSNDVVMITCDKRIIELIYTVIRTTKNSIGQQINNLFGNIFKTNI